ncbi:MAG TPA: inositol monophosphatase [Candidatus Woesebacteria bacterium]|nr:inositol monophosphatase [Candidatus Woesebacteria bacterium]
MLDKQQIETLRNILKEAGEIIIKYFGKAVILTEKSSAADLRTQADLETEKFIIEKLNQNFPNWNIQGEETGLTDKQSEFTFFIDPIEGTSNFAMGIPVFAINLGLMKNKDIVFGMIHNPITKDTYYATSGGGAFVNETKIRVNDENEINRSTVDYNFSYGTPIEIRDIVTGSLRKAGIKRGLDMWCGGYTFCLLASGKIEAVLCEGDQLYDFVAGKLIAKEAGAKITDFKGLPETDITNNRFIASNGKAVQSLLIDILSKI